MVFKPQQHTAIWVRCFAAEAHGPNQSGSSRLEVFCAKCFVTCLNYYISFFLSCQQTKKIIQSAKGMPGLHDRKTFEEKFYKIMKTARDSHVPFLGKICAYFIRRRTAADFTVLPYASVTTQYTIRLCTLAVILTE